MQQTLLFPNAPIPYLLSSSRLSPLCCHHIPHCYLWLVLITTHVTSNDNCTTLPVCGDKKEKDLHTAQCLLAGVQESWTRQITQVCPVPGSRGPGELNQADDMGTAPNLIKSYLIPQYWHSSRAGLLNPGNMLSQDLRHSMHCYRSSGANVMWCQSWRKQGSTLRSLWSRREMLCILLCCHLEIRNVLE